MDIAKAARIGRLGALNRQKTFKASGKTLVVAMDDSEDAKRALRMAMATCNYKRIDTIKVKTIKSDKSEHEKILKDAQAITTEAGLILKPSQFDAVSVASGDDIATTLRKLCEGEKNPVLYMGAAGRSLDEAIKAKSKKPSGQLPMGGVAKECMLKLPAPVVFVKKPGFDCLNTTKGTDELKMHIKGQGKPAVIVCCVDGTPVATRSVDIALHMAKPCDRVIIYHVINSDRDAFSAFGARRNMSMAAIVGTANIKAAYADVAQKARDHDDLDVTFVAQPMAKGKSIKTQILDYIESDDVLADWLVLGSLELGNDQTPGSFGSVAATVAEKCQCSILIVKDTIRSA